MSKTEDIIDSDNLLRRILIHPDNFKDDNTVSSGSFKLRRLKNGNIENGLSVDIERLTTYEKSIIDRKKFRLYSIEAVYVRDLELTPIHDPLPENYAHALIKGKITKGKARKLAASAKKIGLP